MSAQYPIHDPVAGLETDLHLTGLRFNISLAVFYVTYVLVELPSNHLLRYFGAKVWLPGLVFLWGTTTICTAFVTTYASLIGIRLVLGFFEGGLLPGMVLHLSTLYLKDELQLRIGLFFSCSAWSGALGGFLAYAIERMNGVGGKPSWAWIFILENRFKFDYDSWRKSQRTDSKRRSECNQDTEETEKKLPLDFCPAVSFDALQVEKFETQEVWRGILEPQVWMTGFALMFITIATQSFGFFLVIKEMGHDRVYTQLLSAYPYLPASVLVIVISFLADKWQSRGPMILVMLPLSIAGYLMAIISERPKIRYASVFLIGAGLYPPIPCFFTLIAHNTSGMTKRATVTALQTMIANSAGFFAPFLYTSDQAPRFVKGHTIALGLICAAWVLTACNVLYCWKENKARKAGKKDYRVKRYQVMINENKTKAPIGDRDPTFVFTL
ncbi:hypothetical protein CROQUDRAFT_654783 [Cronartium quercuum f. sp. fusiforme G11]|uniref:Major facilitator superfamily transporter n=1 Tax=Cronartium quercuum f. sp. fusiforme G11 TaxID=708437 RepID=A0A9P6NK63_9BASI|nr:hypothetical protein CROQUDRAFT_654783 [Cronartium quercuum f. sp. fusiforme G11]